MSVRAFLGSTQDSEDLKSWKDFAKGFIINNIHWKGFIINNDNMGRRRSKTPTRNSNRTKTVTKGNGMTESIRTMLRPYAESEAGPRFFDVYRTPILDYFFKYFPFLGNEIQYVLLLPFAAWILDPSNLQRLTLRICTRWFLSVLCLLYTSDAADE